MKQYMDKKEIAYSVVKSVLGAIPYGGQAAIEIFENIIVPPIVKRRNDWEERIGAKLAALESEQKIGLAQLCQNNIFTNTLLHVSQIAVSNNQQERLEALENAIINSALPDAPDEVFQQIYLNLVESLSTLHVIMLNRFSGIVLNVKNQEELLKKTFPEMGKNENLYMHIWQDLKTKCLISIKDDDSWGCTITRTPLGHGFIEFISNKDHDKKVQEKKIL